jgi:uncharacterized protein YqgV (UPF0045/DUF77 family)
MFVSLELSYYPLQDDFKTPVNDLIAKLSAYENITIEAGSMSSVISGEYDIIMEVMTKIMGEIMQKYPSVFTMKLSNACMSK